MLLDRLDRYIARNVLVAMLVVQVLILGLDLMITYINDLGDVKGDYGAFEVLLYLLMRLPSRFYEFVPVGVLLGALIGLGSMASSNELTIMRAAGRSLTRILWGVMKPLGLVIAITMAVGEYVAPSPNCRPTPGAPRSSRAQAPSMPRVAAGSARATTTTDSARFAAMMWCST